MNTSRKGNLKLGIFALFCMIVLLGAISVFGLRAVSSFKGMIQENIQVTEDKKPDIDLSKKMFYENKSAQISFSYPAFWFVTTDPNDKVADPTIVDDFTALDYTDGFKEGFFVNKVPRKVNLDKLAYSFKNILIGDGCNVTGEVRMMVSTYDAYRIDCDTTIPSFDGSKDYPAGDISIIIDSGTSYYIFEFSDQKKTIDSTSKYFLEVINSIKFLP